MKKLRFRMLAILTLLFLPVIMPALWLYAGYKDQGGIKSVVEAFEICVKATKKGPKLEGDE